MLEPLEMQLLTRLTLGPPDGTLAEPGFGAIKRSPGQDRRAQRGERHRASAPAQISIGARRQHVVHGSGKPVVGRSHGLRRSRAPQPKGDTGATGAPGPQGALGAPGPGYHFTTASGTNGPTLTNAGTYFVVVEPAPENLTPSAVTGNCRVAEPSNLPGLPPTALFSGDFSLPAESAGTFSYTGMAEITSAPTQLSVQCFDPNGNAVTIENANWWVSAVN
jgi:hypothetical protein